MYVVPSASLLPLSILSRCRTAWAWLRSYQLQLTYVSSSLGLLREPSQPPSRLGNCDRRCARWNQRCLDDQRHSAVQPVLGDCRLHQRSSLLLLFVLVVVIACTHTSVVGLVVVGRDWLRWHRWLGQDLVLAGGAAHQRCRHLAHRAVRSLYSHLDAQWLFWQVPRDWYVVSTPHRTTPRHATRSTRSFTRFVLVPPSINVRTAAAMPGYNHLEGTNSPYKPGSTITQAQATSLLQADLHSTEACLLGSIKVPVTSSTSAGVRYCYWLATMPPTHVPRPPLLLLQTNSRRSCRSRSTTSPFSPTAKAASLRPSLPISTMASTRTFA